MKEEINYPMELVMSDKLKKVLEDSNSIIAKKILELKTLEGCKEWINYLDVAKDDASKISYLNKSRWASLEHKGPIKFQDLKVGDTFTCIDSETVHNKESFGLSSQFGNSFMVTSEPVRQYGEWVLQAKNRHDNNWNFREWDIDICVSNLYQPNIRYMASCGKVIQKLLGQQDGKELAKFCELFQVYHPDFRFTVDFNTDFVKGEAIRYWYCVNNYLNESGSLGSSCMRYENCQDYFDIYTTNDIVSMFVIKDKESNKLVGRCLVWDNKYFDRVYAISTTLEKKIKSYLTTLGLINVYDGDDDITLPITNGSSIIKRFPYCDTFRYVGKDFISNTSDSDYEHELCCTDGYWKGHDDEDESFATCAISSESLNEDDTRYVSGTGYVHHRYTQYSNRDDEYYLAEDCIWCECMHDYIHNDDVTKLYNGEYTIDSRAICMHGGDYADEKDTDLIQLVDEEYALIDECEDSKTNGGYILKTLAHFCDVTKDWVYEHQLVTENEEIES